MPHVRDLTIHMPAARGAELDQDSEWCEVETSEGRRRIRFHDYADIYAIEGLYERLFYDDLECDSPRTVRSLLERVIGEQGVDARSLVALDLGAGNGMVGEQLADLDVGEIIGVDILTAARTAAERDRPGVYDAYAVVDLTEDTPEVEEALSRPFTLMTSVAALGFGDIPPAAFERALAAVEPGGLVAFTIKDRFLEEADESGFSALIADLLETGALEALAERRYTHRLSVAGDALVYRAFVARKRPE